jgi:hypothetical protein
MAPHDTQYDPLRILSAAPSIGAMRFKRHAVWIAAALAFAACVLPFLVYYTGVFTFGPYARGGPWRFAGDYYADLLHLRGSAWVLLLGPVALVALWRALVAVAWPRTRD